MNYQGLRNLLGDIEAEKKAKKKIELQAQLEADREKQYRAEIEEEKRQLHGELEKGMEWEPQPEVLGAIPIMGNAEVDSQVYTELESAKSKTTTTTIGRNQKRLKIANEWYVALCNKLKNNRELVIEKINRLTNEEIKKELKSISSVDEKHLWVSGADRWIKDNGSTVWGFKKTQGGKTKTT